MLRRQEDRQVEWHYIAPGKPMQNGFAAFPQHSDPLFESHSNPFAWMLGGSGRGACESGSHSPASQAHGTWDDDAPVRRMPRTVCWNSVMFSLASIWSGEPGAHGDDAAVPPSVRSCKGNVQMSNQFSQRLGMPGGQVLRAAGQIRDSCRAEIDPQIAV